MVPRAMKLEELEAFMRLHSLNIPSDATHLWCACSVETYLQDHINRTSRFCRSPCSH